MHATDQSVQDLFKQHFGFRPANVARAPGKVELLGSHSDYNEGLVLTIAVDRYAFVAASPRTDGKIELVHADHAPELFWISELKPNPAAPWADPFKAVLGELRLRNVHFSGFNAAIHNEIPTGLGMGEAASSATAAALIVRKLFPFSLGDSGATVPPKRDERGHLPPLPAPERLHFARVIRSALAAAGGGDDGFVDAITSLSGKKWNVNSLDCRFNSLEQLPLIGTAVILCDSGVRDANASVACGKIREHCASAARKLKAKYLRSVEPKTLRAAGMDLDAHELQCATHVTGEIQRTAAAERALRAEDHPQLGNYLSLSHASLRDTLNASCPELDLLVELANALPGCFGARAMGRGFGGATVNLVAYHNAEKFLAQIAGSYEAKSGKKLKPFVCQAVDGAA